MGREDDDISERACAAHVALAELAVTLVLDLQNFVAASCCGMITEYQCAIFKSFCDCQAPLRSGARVYYAQTPFKAEMLIFPFQRIQTQNPSVNKTTKKLNTRLPPKTSE